MIRPVPVIRMPVFAQAVPTIGEGMGATSPNLTIRLTPAPIWRFIKIALCNGSRTKECVQASLQKSSGNSVAIARRRSCGTPIIARNVPGTKRRSRG